MTDNRPFRSEREKTLDELSRALGELFGAERRQRGRERRQPLDLTNSQLRALDALGESTQATAGELAKNADLNPASMSAMLDHLEANGIIERRRAARDRRVCMVSLTDKGRSIVADERDRWQASWDENFRDMPEPDLRAALHVLRRITALLDNW